MSIKDDRKNQIQIYIEIIDYMINSLISNTTNTEIKCITLQNMYATQVYMYIQAQVYAYD